MFKAQSRAGFFSPRVAGDQIGRTAAAAAVLCCLRVCAALRTVWSIRADSGACRLERRTPRQVAQFGYETWSSRRREIAFSPRKPYLNAASVR